MRVLIFGGAGMLGHRLWLTLRERHDTWVTFRQPFSAYQELGIFDAAQVIDRVNVTQPTDLERVFHQVRPDVVVNAVGIVKQLGAAKDAIQSIQINGLFPHQLAHHCEAAGARLLHISTDCVFSGKSGGYAVTDLADPPDLYGKTKLVGEVSQGNALTVRTSIIGREIRTAHGLVEWFLSQRGKEIRGFRRAIFSGFTTQALSVALADIIDRHPGLTGLHHLSAAPIDKYDLLTQLNAAYGANVKIAADDEFFCDRSLNSDDLRRRIGLTPPTWPEMIQELAKDRLPYDQWNR